jgi:hypothetical protein
MPRKNDNAVNAGISLKPSMKESLKKLPPIQDGRKSISALVEEVLYLVMSIPPSQVERRIGAIRDVYEISVPSDDKC